MAIDSQALRVSSYLWEFPAVFVQAGHTQCAEVVCEVLRGGSRISREGGGRIREKGYTKKPCNTYSI